MASTRAAPTVVPQAVRNWLKSQYRDAAIKESWLQRTVKDAGNDATPSALVQHVKTSLLSTRLSECLDRGALPSNAATAKEAIIGEFSPVLVEIIGKLDIGISAQTQLDVLEARSQARMTVGGAVQLDKADESKDEDGDHGGETDHMAGFNAAEEKASLPATVFPRSTIQLTLSDGFTTIKAFEHRRLPFLSMLEPPMGAKLLLKGAKVRAGHVLLDPACVELRGGSVDSLNDDWEERLADELRARLGKPAKPRAAGKAVNNPKARGDAAANDDDDGDDDDEAAIFAEMHNGPTTVKKPSTTTPAAAAATTTKSPYFAKKTSQAKTQPADDEDDDFAMLVPNDSSNPIVLDDDSD